MAPVPKNENIKVQSLLKNENLTQLTGDEIVISGISATYPNSENLVQFMENLYGKKEIINYDSSGKQHPEFPKRFGKLKNWQEFDAQFFRVTHTQATSLNPMSRVLLENAFNAIFDAGINPVTLSGSRVGVYIGTSSTDTTSKLYDLKDTNNYVISGFGQTMMANRISYWINARGPSFAVDLADASSALCLELACKAIRAGDCDSAIVGASNCFLHPFPSVIMKRLGLLCLDGKTNCFNETGDGNVRSEGVGVLFLQKARDAKRIYGEICHVKGKYFPDPDGTFLYTRNPNQLEEFLQEFYSEIKISADDVDFIEANANGFAKSDRQELEAISNVFGRQKPIKVGSIKSNVGNVDSNSAICAIIKICLAYQNGLLSANLYDNEPQNLMKTENDGRVQILTDHTPIKQGAYTAINNFSFTGANYHILLKDHHKPKEFRNDKFLVPYLVLVSGRQEKSVNKILDYLGNNPINVEEIALLRNIFQHNIPGHTSRGYIILDDQHAQDTRTLNRHLDYYPGDNRPVWFLYSGMGSQWPKMGSDLMKIPLFAQSIEKCQKVLIPLEINLLHILSDPDESIFDNILNCFVGIAAVQIGLTDILKEIGIVPDNLIGHSVGELGCAYADGCLTAEEMILAAYYRGLVSIKTKFIKGSMAAIGLGYKAISKLCPPDIAVACHNSDQSSTISGPADKVKQFVAKLTNLGIFAKEVPTANIAYHSEYIKEAGPGLLEYMKSVITEPKLRSEKWLCTSAPRDKWNTAKYASAEYFTNNLLSPVYFEETSLLIPKNALVIEISPHGLLQAIVKRSHPECFHVPLTRRDTNDSIIFLLSAFGKIYEAGLNPDMASMHPEVNFPVSTDTPSISNLVDWEHSEKWDIYEYRKAEKIISANRAVIVLLHDDEYKYIADHVINGVTILPSAAILVFVWETLAMYNNVDYRNSSVIFQNVQFFCEVKVETEELLKLNVEIQKGSQYFEVTYDDMLIATGKVRLILKTASHQLTREDCDYKCWPKGQNLYRILNARGYSYKGDFQSIRRINFEKSQACIQWNNNWVAFLDGLIQLNMSVRDHNGISTINFINQLVINPDNHKHIKTVNIDDKMCYMAEVNRDLYGITKCGGVTMEYITFIDYEKPVFDFILSDKRSRNLKLDPALNDDNMKSLQQIKLASKCNGALERLTWVKESHFERKSSVKVCFAGISLDDVSKAARNVSNDYKFYGMDFSGIDKNGTPVMGVIANGALSKYVSPDEDLTWPIPEYWNLEDAATVPLPYLQAYYCLTIKCELISGDIVFVTDGAGALGQAVISLCLALNCTVYTTVCDEREKVFLLKLFPNLEAKNIFYSGTATSFDPYILVSEEMKCNIIINCSSGGLRKAAMKLLRQFGTFLDMSEYDMKANQDLGMSYFRAGKNYKSVRVLSLLENKNSDEKKILHRRISDGIAQGIVKPLTRVVYTPAAVMQAFRILSSSIHRGRVLVNIAELESTRDKLNIVKRVHCSLDEVQIIASNDSDLAIQHVEHFTSRGATKFIVFIKPQAMTDYMEVKLTIWKSKNLRIHVIFDDDTKDSAYEDLFKSALEIGSIQGVFIYLDKNSGNSSNTKATNTISLLDQASRKIENFMYFIVVSFDFTNKDIDYTRIAEICADRNDTGLHVLHANMPEHNSVKSTSTLFSALETCMYSNLSSVSIQTESIVKSREAYMQNIVSILGVTDSVDLNKSVPLNNLKLTNVQLEEIKSVVREYADIDYPMSALKMMSLASIFEMTKKKEKKVVPSIDSGLTAFYKYICDDHYEASEPIVAMATKLVPTIEREEFLDPEDTHLLMIPGFDGHSHIFRDLAENLKLKALTLQLPPDYKNDSVETIAKNVYKYLKDRINIKSKFYLLGYSFGVLVALELAHILEKEGFLGVVYCLDSSPKALRAQLDAYVGKLRKYELQNAIIMHFHRLLLKENSNQFQEMLRSAEDWQSKISLFTMQAKQKLTISHEYLGCCLDSFYRRILLAYDYEPNFKLDSELVLIKGVPHPEAVTFSNDYGLSDYTSLPVQVFDIDSDHALASYDYKVPNIIHKTLDSALQAELKTKSHCDFYYFTE